MTKLKQYAVGRQLTSLKETILSALKRKQDAEEAKTFYRNVSVGGESHAAGNFLGNRRRYLRHVARRNRNREHKQRGTEE